MTSFKKIKEKIFCPLVTSLIQIFILYVLFFQFFEIKDHYYSSISNARIKAKIESRINECGKDYWLTWIVLDGNSSKEKYFFQDVIGCSSENKADCAFSVKEAKLNKFYNEEFHKVDKKTYEFLTSIDNGVSGYYKDMSFLKNFPAINEVIKNSNKTIYELGISVTKDLRRNLVYVFAMTNTSKENKKCDKDQMILILEDLSIYAKENL
jgi:hypothetical protein